VRAKKISSTQRQVCAQVLQSSSLPQAIGLIYPVIKDAPLPPQGIDFLPPQAIENRHAILAITCGSKKIPAAVQK